MAIPTLRESLAHYQSLLPQEVRTNLHWVTPRGLGQLHLLHISKNTDIRTFCPTVTSRALTKENRSVARISTAPTLAGCIMGYSSDLYDYLERPDTLDHRTRTRRPFRGGWVVYGIPFQAAIRPRKFLVPDVERTDEHWLVTYDQETVEYAPVQLAKFFYRTVTHTAGADTPTTEVEIHAEVLTDTPVRFDNRVTLTRGCWLIRVTGLHSAKAWHAIPQVQVRAMASVDYVASKRLVASLLSIQDPPPAAAWR